MYNDSTIQNELYKKVVKLIITRVICIIKLINNSILCIISLKDFIFFLKQKNSIGVVMNILTQIYLFNPTRTVILVDQTFPKR
jgi:hypothetical protein